MDLSLLIIITAIFDPSPFYLDMMQGSLRIFLEIYKLLGSKQTDLKNVKKMILKYLGLYQLIYLRSRSEFLSVQNFSLTITCVLSFFANRFLPIRVAKISTI